MGCDIHENKFSQEIIEIRCVRSSPLDYIVAHCALGKMFIFFQVFSKHDMSVRVRNQMARRICAVDPTGVSQNDSPVPHTSHSVNIYHRDVDTEDGSDLDDYDRNSERQSRRSINTCDEEQVRLMP